MKNRWTVRLALAAALLIPSYAHAINITINSIVTTINGINVGPLAGWTLPQVLGEGQTLQVGQIGPGFNFDTSETNGCGVNPPACLATVTVQTSVGNFVFTETFAALAGRQNGVDPEPPTPCSMKQLNTAQPTLPAVQRASFRRSLGITITPTRMFARTLLAGALGAKRPATAALISTQPSTGLPALP